MPGIAADTPAATGGRNSLYSQRNEAQSSALPERWLSTGPPIAAAEG